MEIQYFGYEISYKKHFSLRGGYGDCSRPPKKERSSEIIKFISYKVVSGENKNVRRKSFVKKKHTSRTFIDFNAVVLLLPDLFGSSGKNLLTKIWYRI